jgi:hypothetical protein
MLGKRWSHLPAMDQTQISLPNPDGAAALPS